MLGGWKKKRKKVLRAIFKLFPKADPTRLTTTPYKLTCITATRPSNNRRDRRCLPVYALNNHVGGRRHIRGVQPAGTERFPRVRRAIRVRVQTAIPQFSYGRMTNNSPCSDRIGLIMNFVCDENVRFCGLHCGHDHTAIRLRFSKTVFAYRAKSHLVVGSCVL